MERQESQGAREIEAALTGETSQHRQASRRGEISGPAEIEDAYLRRAIAEMSELADEIAAEASSPDGSLPVMSSGAPQAEIAMVKRAPSLVERQEGVAFFGRAGTAILKSVQRLDIDPLQLFGTLVFRREARSDERPTARDLGWLRRELQIVEPKNVGQRAPAHRHIPVLSVFGVKEGGRQVVEQPDYTLDFGMPLKKRVPKRSSQTS